ncbi:MAG: phytanoyl-CoA dioxygenase family protein [Abitibacteriaceae bacterium]|nr:phytanoyl-CoA dioxygenase family protein [Abditibacteriaceae bacterium]
MKLSYAQKQEFIEKGYVKVPGVVPRAMVHEAFRAINHSVGQGMNVEDMTKFRAQSYCPEVTRTPAITDLFNKTPALPLAESLIGEDKIKPVGGGQIALRFPTLKDPPGEPVPHLDGMYSPTNGVPKGQISNFTMLVGVMLSDVQTTYAGNLAVWPGTHRLYEKYFQEHGPESLLNGMPQVEMPKPEQITGQAGDVVFVHYQIAHGVTPNASPNIRYMIFFRLQHVAHEAQKWDAMKDIWLEWEGVREVASGR